MAKSVETGMVIRSSVTVPIAPDAAFRLFTEGATRWWPLDDTFSIYAKDATGVVFEPRVGGRVYEMTEDGRTAEWGTISAWDPGERLALSWYPGQEPNMATQIDIHFSPASGGGTLVDLVHAGWESRGAGAAEAVANYTKGWEYVLGLFAKAA